MEVMIGQLQELDRATAAFARQLGINAVQLNTPTLDPSRGYWTEASVVELARWCAYLDLKLVALENVPQSFMTAIKAGGEDQKRQLDLYRKTIASVGRASIPFLGVNFLVSGVWRTELAADARGGARVSAFDMSQVDRGNAAGGPQGQSGAADPEISADDLWANWERFLHAALPAAEAAGVRLALHPDDPPVPVIGQTARIFHSVETLDRALQMAKGSPAFGFNLCLGTISSMEGGGDAVREAIERFGRAGAICYVHFRQVQGTVPAFRECFLGEGNYSPREAINRLRRSGFDGYLLDDHVPAIEGDTTWGHRAKAHAIGYLQGLLCDPPGTIA